MNEDVTLGSTRLFSFLFYTGKFESFCGLLLFLCVSEEKTWIKYNHSPPNIFTASHQPSLTPMDTLSTSVSGLKVPVFHATHRQFHHQKIPSISQLLLPYFISKPNSSISNKTSLHNSSLKTLANAPHSTSQSSFHSLSPSAHQNPATGYAVALLHIAQHNNNVESVHKDVQRLSKLLQGEQVQAIQANPLVGETEKGLILKEIAKKGKLNRLLTRLLNMLIERNKVIMVNEVLMEFQRIFDELSGTKVVLVSSKKKMKENELIGIAQRVQMMSGAVNVKVRNLVDKKLPSFAM